MSDPIRTVDPSTDSVIAEYRTDGPAAVDAALERAAAVRRSWARTPAVERAAAVSRLADLLEANRERDAELISLEMGKPVHHSAGEIDKCVWVCRHYAERGPSLLEPTPIRLNDDEPEVHVRHDPLGTVLAIMPWNLPFWQVLRFSAPNLVAGNTIVLKHALNVTGSALRIQELTEQAGLPEGVFETLVLENPETEALIGDPRIHAVTLTGSVRAGQAVAGAAGRTVKKVGLELGGSDPFLVLPDADLERAAEVGARARLFVSGQSCIAAKRFIVHSDVADEFRERLAAAMQAYVVGDPRDRATDLGPLARRDLLDNLVEQVAATQRAGAEVVIGGTPLDRSGFYFPPTLLDRVDAAMTAAAEEVFGPAAAMLRADDEDQLIALANRSPYGLGASIFSEDRERAAALAADLEVGNVFVNDMVRSDPRVPFGGVKESGYGRELGDIGIHEFVNIKPVWVS